MDAIEAGYEFAGILGISPRGLTLRQLWRMAHGAQKDSRRENLELANLVWGLAEIDWEDYLLYGRMGSTGKGGPVQVKPDVQEKIDAEIERIRRENPNLPAFRQDTGE
jgi:hypothetical protein